MGVLVGNRGFFPRTSPPAAASKSSPRWKPPASSPSCCTLSHRPRRGRDLRGRQEVRRALQAARAEIDGLIITLPNFGEERGLADAIRLADLRVPVLIQATPDTPGKMSIAFRRDSFCGKMSICNNLKQYGIPYSLTTLHTEAPDSPEFKADLAWFSAVCRIVRGLKNLRFGAIGARPTAFNTVRYSREAAGALRHHRRNARPQRSHGPHRPHDRQRRRRAGKARRHQEVHPHRPDARSRADEDGQARRRHRRMDEGQRTHRLRRAVLDLDRGVPRHRSLHRHVDDEREPHPLRLRGRCARHALHVRAYARQRDALRAARLEQQLRRRPEQGRLLPLLQPAQALLQGRREDGLPAHHCRHRRQGKHPRHPRRHRQGRRR